MRTEPGTTKSLWHGAAVELERSPLTGDARADVCVVGAGIAGLMTAYHLAREGRKVMVVDDGPMGGGETGRTTAHLSDALDDRFYELEKLHGEGGARLAGQSHRAAIERVAEIVHQEGITCDFRWVDGYLFAAPPASTEDDLARECESAARAGVAVEATDSAPYHPFEGQQHALRFVRQARVHPLKLLAGLARCIEGNAGIIHTGTHVKAVHGGSPVRVETDAGATIRASACVVATNSPISDYVVTHAKMAPYRTFAIAARVPKGSVPDALYWNNANPYIYIRVQQGDGHDWLIVGGEDYKTGHREDDAQRLVRLVQWARARFPMVESIDYQWSGQVLEPNDGLAFTGRNPDGAENVYLHTADSGQGMTHGTIAGMLLTDLIMGRENAWAALYDPKRVSMGLSAAREFVKENLDVAAQYAAYVLPGDVPSETDVPRGSGRVVRHGTKMVAVYRDDEGRLHERSAVCTHLKCIVNWNELESSWDCPCHGSRFAPLGDVLNGPALAPLEELDGDG
ncbi:MAG TPA: FAD-dependent oxidoreductase [Longimicrobiales bacterium]|nr:FAD-dependent oxidoreductase [Longimicrobiales bacterium]